MKLFVDAVGLAGPGLPNWNEARAVLAGTQAYAPQDLPPYSPELLPPNERRRATPSVRLAFRTAEDALRGTELRAGDLATVFATSDGDLEVLHRINQALAQPARIVSPTDFHNSVHNAAAGYWSIAVGARGPSASIAAYDLSFAAGLLEAAALVAGDRLATLLVVCDTPAPLPLLPKRPIGAAFGAALVLAPQRGARTLATLQLELVAGRETALSDPALEQLRCSNPAARALPLLRLLARRESGSVTVPGAGSAVQIGVTI